MHSFIDSFIQFVFPSTGKSNSGFCACRAVGVTELHPQPSLVLLAGLVQALIYFEIQGHPVTQAGFRFIILP